AAQAGARVDGRRPARREPADEGRAQLPAGDRGGRLPLAPGAGLRARLRRRAGEVPQARRRAREPHLRQAFQALPRGARGQAVSLILASASPRRREILGTLGIAFDVVPSGASEDAHGEAPEALARRLARDKALEVSRRSGERFVLGADTIVVEGGRVLGKPADDEEGRAMLARLAGRWHEVITGVALARNGVLLEDVAVTTRVHMLALEPARIERYVASGEGRDKAGGYAVQG